MIKMFVSAAAIAAAFALPGLADDEGWYLKAGVGYGAPDEIEREGDGSLPFGLSVDPEAGPRFALGGGYDYGEHWRSEVEVVDRFTDAGNPANGGDAAFEGDSSFQNVAVMLNGYYDVKDYLGRVTPYVGAGVGVAQTSYSGTVSTGGPAALPFDDTEIGVAAQALAGASVTLTKRITGDVGYRYYTDLFDLSDNEGNFARSLDKFHSHDLMFSLRYALGGGKKAAKAAAPAAATAAAASLGRQGEAAASPLAQVCEDVPIVIYFELDRSSLTNQAKTVIANAAERAAVCGVADVVVTGHTDRSGGAGYNARLSERRARVVRDELITLGVPASVIAIEGKGESEPVIKTADGLREALNRRSEVLIRVVRPTS